MLLIRVLWSNGGLGNEQKHLVQPLATPRMTLLISSPRYLCFILPTLVLPKVSTRSLCRMIFFCSAHPWPQWMVLSFSFDCPSVHLVFPPILPRYRYSYSRDVRHWHPASRWPQQGASEMVIDFIPPEMLCTRVTHRLELRVTRPQIGILFYKAEFWEKIRDADELVLCIEKRGHSVSLQGHQLCVFTIIQFIKSTNHLLITYRAKSEGKEVLRELVERKQ